MELISPSPQHKQEYFEDQQNAEENSVIYKDYNEDIVAEYMREKNIEIYVEIGTGKERFKVYTTDLTKKYIEINSDYRT